MSEKTSSLRMSTNFYKNTVAKIVVSEVLGGVWYCLEFIVFMCLVRGKADSMTWVRIMSVSILFPPACWL